MSCVSTFVVLLFFASKTVLGAGDVCHGFCDCYPSAANQDTVSCISVSPTVVPQPFSSNTKEIYLSNTNITKIRIGQFNSARNLNTLHLEHNMIDYIEPGAFGGLMKLKRIYLPNNLIQSIVADVFSHLPSLSYIDLSNNHITSINRYSFFYLPSLTTVNMEGNQLICGCEERGLGEFLQLSSASLENDRCVNLDNKSITDVSNSLWANVTGCTGETLFRSGESNKCYTCADAKGLIDCQTKDELQQCRGDKDVCFMSFDYTDNNLRLTGGCIEYRSCMMLYEARNVRACNTATARTRCTFCNSEQTLKNEDVVGTIKTFKLLVLVTLAREMTTELAGSGSQDYLNFVKNITVEFQNHLYGLKGSFWISYFDLRAPNVSIALKIVATTMWFIEKSDVMESIRVKLLNVTFNGSEVESVQVDALNSEMCEPETEPNAIYGTLSWPQAASNKLYSFPCPFQPLEDKTALVYRRCDHIGIWSTTNFTQCATKPITTTWPTTNVTQCSTQRITSTLSTANWTTTSPGTTTVSQISRELESVLKQEVTVDNVDSVSANLSEISRSWEVFKSEDVSLTIGAIEKVLNLPSPPADVINNTIATINNVLFVSSGTLSQADGDKGASTRLLSIIEDISNKINVTTEDFTVVKENLAMFVSRVDDVDNFTGRSMWLGKAHDGSFSDSSSLLRTSAIDTTSGQSGIVIDPSLLDGISTTDKGRISQISIFALRDSRIYTSASDLNVTKEIVLSNKTAVLATRSINSNVLSATIPGVAINNLEKPVKITFSHFNLGENAECVYWDIDNRVWSSEGCVLNSTTSDRTVCHCNHLTNFALLMDVYGYGGQFTKTDLQTLSIISYVGCTLSFLALILTIITLRCIERKKRDKPSTILVNLCVAIGLVNLTFILGVQDYVSKHEVACKIVGALLHYLLLAVMCWMVVEASYMYQVLVKIFNTNLTHFQLKSTLFGWGIPLVVVIITLSVNTTDNYGVQPGNICWLDRIPFYAAFLGPVCVTMVVNALVFTLVLRQICRRTPKQLSKSDSKRGTMVVRARGAITLVILLGLTWLFAILAVGDFGKVFHYLFALTNTLQGSFIFIFYCVLKPEARTAWKMSLPCFRKVFEIDERTPASTKGTVTSTKLTEDTECTVSTKDESSKPEQSSTPLVTDDTVGKV